MHPIPLKLEPEQKWKIVDLFNPKARRRSVFARARNAAIQGNLRLVRELVFKSEGDVTNSFLQEWRLLFGDIFAHFVKDGSYGPSEREYLTELATVLEMPQSVRESIDVDARRIFLVAAIRRSILAGPITPETLELLRHKAKQIGVEENDFLPSYQKAAVQAVTEVVTEAMADGMISPTEARRIDEVIAGIKVTITNLDEIEQLLQFGKRRWAAMNDEIQPLTTDLQLQKGEQLCFEGVAIWYELRSVTRRVDYVGISTRVRVAKGLYLKSGSIYPQVYRQDQLLPIDEGRLCLTNKRLLFIGAKGNKAIPWRSVVHLAINSMGEFEIGKATGKRPLIRLVRSDRCEVWLATTYAQRFVAAAAV